MATSYPGGIDNFTNPGPTDYEDVISHSGQHSNANDAIEAVEAVLGTTAGTSVLKDFSSGQFPARINSGGTLSQVLTGGTLNGVVLGTVSSVGGTFTNPIINIGSDAAGDMYYRGTAGNFARLPAGTANAGRYLTTDGTTPSWGTVSSGGSVNLLSLVQTNLGSNFTAGTGTAEQEVTGLRVSLPIVSGGTSCTVRAIFKGYYTTAAGDNTLRIRIGTSTSYLTNTERDNLYVGGSKTLETFTGIVVVPSLNLTTQNYVVISLQNGTNANGMALSASGARTTVVTEVYR